MSLISPFLPSRRSLIIFALCFQVWGVTIGGTVLQNELKKRLPAAFLAQVPQGSEVAFSVIPVIAELEEPLRNEVRAAFAGSMQVFWQVLTGIGGIGFLASLFMKGIPLHDSVDKEWSRKELHPLSDAELAVEHRSEKVVKI